MDVQFSDLSVPCKKTRYLHYLHDKPSFQFTHLMKLVICVRKFPDALDLIKEILNNKPMEINKQNSCGLSALAIACKNANTHSSNEVIKMLINAGADVNLKSQNNFTPLMHACRNPNNCETVRILVNANADLNYHLQNNSSWPNCALSCAMVSPQHDESINLDRIDINIIETVKILINAGVDVNCGNRATLFSPLIYACHIPNAMLRNETFRILIDAGIDVNIKNIGFLSQTSLMFACTYWYNDTIKLLLDSGSDANILDNRMESALYLYLTNLKHGVHDAAEDQVFNIEIFMYLLVKSKDVIYSQNYQGLTCYDYYINNGFSVLDDYQLKLLKGEIIINNTKSAMKSLDY